MADFLHYGYNPGLISNSMLQAAVVCPLKYKLLYLDRITLSEGKIVMDAMFAGSILHKCLELHDGPNGVNHEELLPEAYRLLSTVLPAPLVTKTRTWMNIYLQAVAATQKSGEQYGRVYRAPEMTSFWKKKYSKSLDVALANLDLEAEEFVICDVPYTDIMKAIMRSLSNWPSMKLGEATSVELNLTGEVTVDGITHRLTGTLDRVEVRDGGVAICDYKSGKWAYTPNSVANSDAFVLYDHLLRSSGVSVVEWCVYDIYLGQVVRVLPTEAMRTAGRARLEQNLRYLNQLHEMAKVVELPVPAGASFKTGCPCILAKTGHCTFIAPVIEGE